MSSVDDIIEDDDDEYLEDFDASPLKRANTEEVGDAYSEDGFDADGDVPSLRRVATEEVIGEPSEGDGYDDDFGAEKEEQAFSPEDEDAYAEDFVAERPSVAPPADDADYADDDFDVASPAPPKPDDAEAYEDEFEEAAAASPSPPEADDNSDGGVYEDNDFEGGDSFEKDAAAAEARRASTMAVHAPAADGDAQSYGDDFASQPSVESGFVENDVEAAPARPRSETETAIAPADDDYGEDDFADEPANDDYADDFSAGADAGRPPSPQPSVELPVSVEEPTPAAPEPSAGGYSEAFDSDAPPATLVEKSSQRYDEEEFEPVAVVEATSTYQEEEFEPETPVATTASPLGVGSARGGRRGGVARLGRDDDAGARRGRARLRRRWLRERRQDEPAAARRLEPSASTPASAFAASAPAAKAAARAGPRPQSASASARSPAVVAAAESSPERDEAMDALLAKIASLEARLDERERGERRAGAASAKPAAKRKKKQRPRSAPRRVYRPASPVAERRRAKAKAHGPVRAWDDRFEEKEPQTKKPPAPSTYDASTGHRVNAKDYEASLAFKVTSTSKHATTMSELGLEVGKNGSLKVNKAKAKWTDASAARLVAAGAKPYERPPPASPPKKVPAGYPTTALQQSARHYVDRCARWQKIESGGKYGRLLAAGDFKGAAAIEPRRPFDPSKSPANEPRTWKAYKKLRRWDALVTVEAIPNRGRQLSTRHDPSRYAAEADKAARAALDALGAWGVRAASVVSLVESPANSGDKNRVGALEVQVAVVTDADAGPRTKVVFSKIARRTWPSESYVKRRVDEFLGAVGAFSAADARKTLEDAPSAPWPEDGELPWDWDGDNRPAPDARPKLPDVPQFVEAKRNGGAAALFNNVYNAPAAETPPDDADDDALMAGGADETAFDSPRADDEPPEPEPAAAAEPEPEEAEEDFDEPAAPEITTPAPEPAKPPAPKQPAPEPAAAKPAPEPSATKPAASNSRPQPAAPQEPAAEPAAPKAAAEPAAPKPKQQPEAAAQATPTKAPPAEDADDEDENDAYDEPDFDEPAAAEPAAVAQTAAAPEPEPEPAAAAQTEERTEEPSRNNASQYQGVVYTGPAPAAEEAEEDHEAADAAPAPIVVPDHEKEPFAEVGAPRGRFQTFKFKGFNKATKGEKIRGDRLAPVEPAKISEAEPEPEPEPEPEAPSLAYKQLMKYTAKEREKVEHKPKKEAPREKNAAGKLVDYFAAHGYASLAPCAPALVEDGFDTLEALSTLTEEDALALPNVRRGHAKLLAVVAKRVANDLAEAALAGDAPAEADEAGAPAKAADDGDDDADRPARKTVRPLKGKKHNKRFVEPEKVKPPEPEPEPEEDAEIEYVASPWALKKPDKPKKKKPEEKPQEPEPVREEFDPSTAARGAKTRPESGRRERRKSREDAPPKPSPRDEPDPRPTAEEVARIDGAVSAAGLRRLVKKRGLEDPTPAVLEALLTAVDIDGDGAVPPQDAAVFARGQVPGGEGLGTLWRSVRAVVSATKYDVTRLEEQLFAKYDADAEGHISLKKFRSTLEKVAKKTRDLDLDGADWGLVQAIWGVPDRIDYVTFCSWLNPTKTSKLKAKASRLAVKACKESGETDGDFWTQLCMRHAPPAEAQAFEMLLYDGRKKKKKQAMEEEEDPMLRKERRKSKAKAKKKERKGDENDEGDAGPGLSSLGGAPKLT
ncbi:hypothetical protein JL720_5152 [Aureococcus anophagefferens]|nr:hypothetical protein JL720_5152 [Aureococcus anophagefferens]